MPRNSNPSPEKHGLHPRNRHASRYDFSALIACFPELTGFIRRNPAGNETIDFANPEAVMALNRALLKCHYGITHWEIPPGYLCPPIPGRAEYVHHLADLLAGEPSGAVPRGPGVVILDIGVGANCIYPILGACEYGWRFVGSDIDPAAVAAARRIVAANPNLAGQIEIRLQRSPTDLFAGIVHAGETFAAAMCNPPYHSSPAEAAAGTQRKLRNLTGKKVARPVLNFGGQQRELWCVGGEVAFIRRMIAQSADQPKVCRWFTTLVSKRDSLPAIERALWSVKPVATRIIELSHGQKKSRIVAWRFA